MISIFCVKKLYKFQFHIIRLIILCFVIGISFLINTTNSHSIAESLQSVYSCTQNTASCGFIEENTLYNFFENGVFTLIKLRTAFDTLDQNVNKGNGYKDNLNSDGFPTGGLLAWSQSYLMQGYAELYRATGDEYYLEKLLDHSESVMKNRDDYKGQTNHSGYLVPAWGTNFFTKVGDWKHFITHTAMIVYPMIELVDLVRKEKVERFYLRAEILLSKICEAVNYHDNQWVLQESGHGLYTYDEGYYGRHNYIIPLSMQATMGRTLLMLWQVTQEDKYRDKAIDIAFAIKNSMEIDKRDNGYIWGVHVGPLSNDNRVADISHSAITIHFVVLAHEAGIIFDKNDIICIVTTVKRCIKNDRATSLIDGTGGDSLELSACQLAFLSLYDNEIWIQFYNILFNLYMIEITGKYLQEDWWGVAILSIARLAGSFQELLILNSEKK
jgi:hypothetical protein